MKNADRHYELYQMLREESPINPNKMIPGAPAPLNPPGAPKGQPLMPAPKPEPRKLNRQRILASMIRGG